MENKIKAAYSSHKCSANKRNIEFLFSYEEWKNWWLTDDRWQNRGRGGNNFCMARKNDCGPYSPNNVYCATMVQNMRDSHWDTERRRKASNILKGKFGYLHHKSRAVSCDGLEFGSAREAARHYDIGHGSIVHRIKSEKYPDYFYIEDDNK